MTPWGWILLAGLCVSCFFSGSETAVVSCDRLRQRAEGGRGKRLARLAERLYHNQERTLALLLVGNNVANITISIAALVITQVGLEAMGIHLPALWRDLISSLWVSLLVLFEEILTKGFGHSYAVKMTRFSAPPLIALNYVLFPLLWVVSGFVNWVQRLVDGSDRTGQDAGVSWETLWLHLETGRALGFVEKEEEAVIRRIGQMSGRTARELMVPLERLRTLPLDTPIDEIKRQLKEAPAMRIFLYDGSPSNLARVVSTHRLLGRDKSGAAPLKGARLRRIPAFRNLVDLVDEMEIGRNRFLGVTALDGRCIGVVFLRDLLRQLVLTHRATRDLPPSAEDEAGG